MAAQSLAGLISQKHPELIKSQPFLEWVVTKAAESSFETEQGSKTNPLEYLRKCPGMTLWLDGYLGLPIYVPLDFGIPGWFVPDIPGKANAPIRMVLALAIQLQDYQMQVLCLKLLIIRCRDPSELFEQLAHL
jgi:hypothetical protein